MTYDQALKIVGKQPRWALRAMVKALKIHPWLNTEEENERLSAGIMVLKGNHVTKRTRAGRNGKEITCPKCGTSRRAYHFCWSDLECQGCHDMIPKMAWRVTNV